MSEAHAVDSPGDHALIPDLFTNRQTFVVVLQCLLVVSNYCCVRNANVVQQERLSTLVASLFKNSEALLKQFESLRRAVLTVVDHPKLTQRIAQSRPISGPFRNLNRKLRDSQCPGIIAFLIQGSSKRFQGSQK